MAPTSTRSVPGLSGRPARTVVIMGSPYHQFCPVAKAMELLDERWTLLVIRELLAGSRHFNDLRRGLPRMSPTLLSKRLNQLVASGVVERRRDGREVVYVADPGRRGAALGDRAARGLGDALDRGARRCRSRPEAADVGPAPQRGSGPGATRHDGGAVRLHRPRGPAGAVVDRADPRRGRRLRCRSRARRGRHRRRIVAQPGGDLARRPNLDRRPAGRGRDDHRTGADPSADPGLVPTRQLRRPFLDPITELVA